MNNNLALDRATGPAFAGKTARPRDDNAMLKAAASLTRPASAARALQNGVPYIERADKLVQLVARQKGLRHPVIDRIVDLVDTRLHANREKAAGR